MSSKLPKVKMNDELTGFQRESLSQWLEDWRLELALRGVRPDAVSPDDPGGSTVNPGSMAEPADTNLEEGQVRLAAPSGDDESMVYFAVLGKTQDGLMRIAPFGRCPNPGLPLELSIQHEHSGLKTLCVWAAGELRPEQLVPSWETDELTLEDLDVAKTLLIRNRPGKDVEQSRTGPRLRHPLDPRWEYIELEADRFRQCLGVPASIEDSTTRITQASEPGRYSLIQDLKMAAEPGDQYKVPVTITLEPGETSLHVELIDEGLFLLITVLDASGKQTQSLDGGIIETASGQKSDEIQDGAVNLASNMDLKDAVLIHPDGTRSRLI